MKNRLPAVVLATALASGVGVIAAPVAQAGPADGAAKRHQIEAEDYAENQRTPAYQKIPDCCEMPDSWGFADAILAVTFAVGLIVLY